MTTKLPVAFLCSAVRSELSDLDKCFRDCPVRAPAVQERLARIRSLVAKLEEHAETDKGAANDGE